MEYSQTTPTKDEGYLPDAAAQERSRRRLVFENVILHLHPATVPAAALRFTYTWGLGGASAILAMMLALTGVLLMFRYDADVETAYSTILALETQVPFGSLVRAIHHWSANLLVITVFLHLVRVFLTGAFKQRRGWNWVIGLSLLLLVLASNFTGYLLPWDQLAYWAVTVVTSLLGYIPAIGTELSRLLLGGPEVGQGALRNFYALHVAVIPVIMVFILSYHFWKVRKNGGISQPLVSRQRRIVRVTTIPHLIDVEIAAALVVIVSVVIFSMLVPAPLEEMANSLNSPNPAKAAWYFLGLQELLLHMHPLAAMLLLVIILGGLIALPLFDRHALDVGIYFRSPVGRQSAILGAFLSLDLIPILVLLDEYWLDMQSLLPALPIEISNGLIPLVLSLAGLAGIYLLARRFLKANHSEGLVAVFMFLVTSLVLLTIVGVFFRGPNMALVLPF